MADHATERERAIAAADETCPRCGGRRQPDQHYCLDCGLRLPVVTGRVASLRRRWLRQFGWYPGDWVWVSLLTLAVAAAGGAAAILLSAGDASANGQALEGASSAPTVVQPGTVPAGTTRRAARTTLPTAPEPGTGAKNGRLTWPRNENGWTIVLVSYPKASGAAAARQTAARAAKAGLAQAGILDSSGYASLQPRYLVVFAGIYGSPADAGASGAPGGPARLAGA